jgi:lipopolysaccharide assembly outer membrane protein LptD (OstA)
MKKLLLLTLLGGIFTTYSQNLTAKAVSVSPKQIEAEGDAYKVRSKEMTFNKKKNTVEYTKDVVFITDDITIEADNVVFNNNTKEVVATGNFRATGVTIEFNTSIKPKTLRYKLGDTVAFLE